MSVPAALSSVSPTLAVQCPLLVALTLLTHWGHLLLSGPGGTMPRALGLRQGVIPEEQGDGGGVGGLRGAQMLRHGVGQG